MVTEWGMSEKVGPISYGSDKEVFIGRDMASHVNYSEETAAIIDSEIRQIIDNGLKTARAMLSKNKKLLDNMARLLVERETIYSEEVDMLMEGKSVEEIMAFMDANENAMKENPFNRKGIFVSEKEAQEKKTEKKEEQAQEIKETNQEKTEQDETKE